jgi:zinc transport system substrate-binding protein
MSAAKKLVPLLLCLCLILSGCSVRETEEKDSSKLQIVCTNFPAYDFAREIAGDRAQIKLLIKPGAEVHSYEPAPKDVIAIQESDLFICNGGESEAWVESLVGDSVNALRMMDCVETVAESGEGIYAAEDEHDHEHDDGEEEELDEHVWTTPGNAAKICYALCDKLCELDQENANEYMLNYEVYNAKLMELDIEIRTTVLNGVRDTLIFADRFPMRYFTREYGLKYYAAYPGCASQTEPSAKTVAFLIDHVREEKIPAVLYMEFSNEKMADVICEDTGCEKLPFYSAHSVTAQQFEDGVTYLDLMRMNIETLKEALY